MEEELFDNRSKLKSKYKPFKNDKWYMRIIKKMFGYCPCCGIWFWQRGKMDYRRLNTAYVEEESNWLYSCEMCYDETVEHYQDLWDEYNSGRL